VKSRNLATLSNSREFRSETIRGRQQSCTTRRVRRPPAPEFAPSESETAANVRQRSASINSEPTEGPREPAKARESHGKAGGPLTFTTGKQYTSYAKSSIAKKSTRSTHKKCKFHQKKTSNNWNLTHMTPGEIGTIVLRIVLRLWYPNFSRICHGV